MYSDNANDNSTPLVADDIRRPNILFILTDDQGIGDLSLHSNDSISTPYTDQLLRESVRFSRFYVSPVCAPTRASFLSGQYHPRTGAFFVTRRAETMTDSVMTIAELLRDRGGYRTGLFGKWHNGATYPYNPVGQGFDRFLGFCMGHYNSYYNYKLEDERGEQVPFNGYITDTLTDAALDFTGAEQSSSQPWFCMLTFPAPHTPIQAPDSLFNKYQALGLTDYNAGIYAMVEANDHYIGRLIDSLEARDDLDNTIVIFSTDNGPNGSRYTMGLKGHKGQVDEGGVRVPFGIRLPNEHPANGKIVNHLAAHIDLLPTLVELTGIALPDELQTLDGQSLVPLVEELAASEQNGKKTKIAERPGMNQGNNKDKATTKTGDNNVKNKFNRRIYTFKQGYDFSPWPGAFRTQDTLYIRRSVDEHELYDLSADESQRHNYFEVSNPAHQQIAESYLRFANQVARPDLVAPPIEFGHATAPLVRLLAHEGEVVGRARFHDQYGWANDWAENIRSTEDGIQWPVRVVDKGIYALEVEYALTKQSEATEETYLQIDFAKKRRSLLLELYQNEDLPTRDLVKRKEVYPRTWKKVRNFISLPEGEYVFRLSLESKSIDTTYTLAIKSATLRSISE
ncbi:MAG: sulfatase-like hydrolase/transferase [Bacteroidota bacterium]